MRRSFTLAFVAFFLLAGAWALALPINGTYDEKQHIVRAWAVMTGQLVPHQRAVDATGYPTDGFTAPRSLLPANPDCTWFPKNDPKPASCLRMVDDRSETTLASGAGRYSPVYYALVGLPIRMSPDQTGIIWARLLSAAIGALLLAGAVAVAVRLGNPLLVAAVALVSTPLAMNLNGSINPNGLEISAGVLLFASLLALLRGQRAADAAAPRWLLALAGTASALLLTVRNLGPVLFGLAVLACLIAAAPGRMRVLARRRAARWWLGGLTAVGLLFTAVWTYASRITDIAPLPERSQDLSAGEILRHILNDRAEFYVRQIVAQFNYGETTVSIGMIAIWYSLVAAVVVPALWFGDRRLRVAVLGIVFACALLLVGLELYFVPRVGWFSHSRYAMPVGVGAVILPAFADRYTQWLAQRGWLHRLATVLVLATVPLDLYALARVMTRFQRGLDAGLNPFGGTWQPPLGPVVPLMTYLVGAVLLAAIVTSSSVRPAPQHSTVNTLSN